MASAPQGQYHGQCLAALRQRKARMLVNQLAALGFTEGQCINAIQSYGSDLEQAVASAGGSGQRAGTILLAGSRLRSADLCVKRDLDVGKVLKENIDVDMLLFGQPAQHLW